MVLAPTSTLRVTPAPPLPVELFGLELPQPWLPKARTIAAASTVRLRLAVIGILLVAIAHRGGRIAATYQRASTLAIVCQKLPDVVGGGMAEPAPHRNRPVTINDIAALTGVAASTVSRALSNPGRGS